MFSIANNTATGFIKFNNFFFDRNWGFVSQITDK